MATPIGNMGDMSRRASESLAEADVVLAEDTRRTKALLPADASVKLVSCHQHNELDRLSLVREVVTAGGTVVLVSDAGAPAISDPGGRLVEAAVKAGIEVGVIPGPSAVISALMGAGFHAQPFTFLGFLSRKAERQKRALLAVPETHALVIFESANRVEDLLQAAFDALGPRRVVVARELTKKFETFHRGKLGGLLTPALVDKGEIVVVIDAAQEKREVIDPSVAVSAILNDGNLKPRAKAKALAPLLGISTQEAYARLQAGTLDVSPAQKLFASIETSVREYLQLEGEDAASLSGDALLEALAAQVGKPSKIKAPLEVKELQKALLAALHGCEEMLEAMEMAEESAKLLQG